MADEVTLTLIAEAKRDPASIACPDLDVTVEIEGLGCLEIRSPGDSLLDIIFLAFTALSKAPQVLYGNPSDSSRVEVLDFDPRRNYVKARIK